MFSDFTPPVFPFSTYGPVLYEHIMNICFSSKFALRISSVLSSSYRTAI